MKRSSEARNLGEQRYTFMVVPEGGKGSVRQITVNLATLRRWLALAASVALMALVGLVMLVTALPRSLSYGGLLDENLALRSRLGEMDRKLDLVEREMQRIRFYGSEIEEASGGAIPGFGPLETDELDAAAALGEDLLVDPGRPELPGEDGVAMDEHPGDFSIRVASGDAVEQLMALDARTEQLLAALRLAELELGHKAEIAEHQLSMQAAIPTAWPTREGVLTSGFGWRRSPFTRRWKFHTGLDLAAARGTPIAAPAPGTVVTAEYQPGYGRVVEIDHGHGILTRYAHNARLYVATGQPVRKGEIISTVGMTGATTGPHLHYEIHVDGVPVDPLEYLD